MSSFLYDIPLAFTIEGPRYREGELKTMREGTSYVSMSIKQKLQDLETQLSQPIQQFTQEDIIKCSIQLEFEIIMDEFQNQQYDLLRVKTFSGNLMAISFVSNDYKFVQVNLSRSDIVVKFQCPEFSLLEKQKLKLQITNELNDGSETFLKLTIGNQSVRIQKKTEDLRDLFRQLLQVSQISVQLGNPDPTKAFIGRIQNITFQSIDAKVLNEPENQRIMRSLNKKDQIFKQDIRIGHKVCGFTNPIDSLYQLSIWNPDNAIISEPTQKIKKIIRKEGKPQVIICHDMANGYKEDSWVTGNHNLQHAYRFYNMLHCDIFIYFSHRFVTIPPQPYINICHQYGVKILGNLITEWEAGEKINEGLFSGAVTDPMTGKIEYKDELFYAEQLVNIAKYYGFDGWLINIEAKVNNPEALTQFISYLRTRIQEEIPGGIVVYYDSIIQTGELKWQSQLNSQNEQFFNAAENIFTDYKWNLQKIQESAQYAGQKKHRVFTGIDIFGRGVFGGGQENTYKALQAIKQHGTSIALFAPGWTYEVKSNGNKSKFISEDEAFWNGSQKINLFDPKIHKWTIEKNGGNGWKTYYDDQVKSDVAIASFDYCIRSFTVALKQFQNLPFGQVGGKIVFSLKTRGTGPKFDDPFLCSIEILNAQYQCIASLDSLRNILQYGSVPFSQFNIANENWSDIRLTLLLDLLEPQIKQQAQYIQFREVGKDQEYWAGHFGTQFSSEDMYFIITDPDKNLLRMLSPRRIHELPIQTYFNDGVGPCCYIDGTRYNHFKGYYNILNDFDFSFPYASKKIKNLYIGQQNYNLSLIYETSLCEKEAWNGSTCLQIKGVLESGQSCVIKFFKTYFKPQGQLYLSLNLKNFDKNMLKLNVVFKTQDNQYIKFEPSKVNINQGWDSVQFLVPNLTQIVKGIYLLISNNKMSRQTFDGLLGGLGIYDDAQLEGLDQIFKIFSVTKKVDFKDPSKYVKTLVLRESLKSIDHNEKNSMLVDLYIEFDFPPEILAILKTVRVFKDKTQWLTNCRGTKLFVTEIAYNWMSSPEFQIRLQIVLSNGYHMKAESTTPIILTKEQIQMLD